MSDTTLRDVLQYLAEERNLDLRGYKATSLDRRFRHRMFQVKMGSYAEYLEYLRAHPDEVNRLLNIILIKVTHFFRDPQAWDVLRREVIPELAGQLRPGDSFRAWSAGCATGEEAYSMAILLSDYFGDAIRNYDVKVYATDVDEDALNAARRGAYPADKLRYVRADWRAQYFQGAVTCHVSRPIRRLCIFGRNNLASEAPISHTNLLLCRNVLIYFDSKLQRETLRRLHYALEPRGALMLGKAETHLSQSPLFAPINAKWRIFRRAAAEDRRKGRRAAAEDRRKGRRAAAEDRRKGRRAAAFRRLAEEEQLTRKRQDNALLKTYQDAILSTLEPGVMVLDNDDIVLTENESSLRLFGVEHESTVGKNISQSAINSRCADLLPSLQGLHAHGGPTAQFECAVGENADKRLLRVTLRSITSASGKRIGTVIYAEDVTTRQKLQETVEELETTSEELQSTNEELETTNEELQYTNEELEATNEELQSTNEELETTNEELQVLNEELGATNEELEVRTRELDEMNVRYAETLCRIPWPVMLVDADQVVQVWNSSVQDLFGLSDKSVVGLELKQLPVAEELRRLLTLRCREASARAKDLVLRNQKLETRSYNGSVNIRFTPLRMDPLSSGVLIVLEPTTASGERPTAIHVPSGRPKKKKTTSKTRVKPKKRR